MPKASKSCLWINFMGHVTVYFNIRIRVHQKWTSVMASVLQFHPGCGTRDKLLSGYWRFTQEFAYPVSMWFVGLEKNYMTMYLRMWARKYQD